jgi:hypothetical protein
VETFVANTIPSISGAVPNLQQTLQKLTGTPPATTNIGIPPDRIARQGSPLPALLLGATAAAQLVPGVIEAEGTTGAATAIGIAVRSATANPVAKALMATSAGAIGSYARSLVHDAAAGQPAFKSIGDLGHSLDVSIRTSFGIPQSDARP